MHATAVMRHRAVLTGTSCAALVALLLLVTLDRGREGAPQAVDGAEAKGGVGLNATPLPLPVPTWTPGEPDVAAGMSFDPPTIPPVVSQERAVQAANSADYASPSAPRISARHVLMSFKNPDKCAESIERSVLGMGRMYVRVAV